MDTSKINQKVAEILVDQLGATYEQVTPEAKIIEDLGADSLDQVELVMAVEEEFDIEITDEESMTLTTVQAIIDFVAAKTA